MRVQIVFNELNEKFIEISVKDTGIGIAKKDQKKLFKLFGFVQDSKQMNTKGIGLGLVISEQIVTQFSGSMSFESELDVGSTFTYRFKLDDEDIPQLEQENGEKEKFHINCNKFEFKWQPEGKDPKPLRYVDDLDNQTTANDETHDLSIVLKESIREKPHEFQTP